MRKVFMTMTILGLTYMAHAEGPNFKQKDTYTQQEFDNVYQDLRKINNKNIPFVNVKDFGAKGDGSSDDTVSIQAAINSIPGGGTVFFPPGTYRINKNVGVNDRWGIKITSSNISLTGYGASLRRYNIDLSTWSYPIVFIGVPDSNTAPAVNNVRIEGLTFIGEDTRHSDSGSDIHDGRCAIEIKNSTAAYIGPCSFTKIDSAAIYFQKPAEYDYFNNVYYNLTKSYHGKIIGNSFVAQSHAVPGRAFIHAISSMGIDDLVISNNYFEWCDNTVSQESTYGKSSDVETDLYPSGTVMGSVKRTGRWIIFSNNLVYNSSEHSVYFGGMDVTITGNTFRVDNTTVCPNGDIKLRAGNVTVSGNSLTCGSQCISVNEPSNKVSISGNQLFAGIDGEGGVININSDGLSSYITNRPWYNSGFFPMDGIVVNGNNIQLSSAPQTYGIGVRVLTDDSDANYPDGQIQDLIISNNVFRNHRNAILFFGPLTKEISILGNTFHAKSFVTAGFSTSTIMNTESIVNIYHTTPDILEFAKFNDNNVYGSSCVFKTDNGMGTNVHIPWGITNNRFDYVQFLRSTDTRNVAVFNQFKNNTGIFFLDRTWGGAGYGNSLFSIAGTDNSSFRYNFIWDGINLKFYTDDNGSYVNLSTAGATGSTINVQDGGSTIVNTSTVNFSGASFIVTNSAGAALINLDPSSVTLLGQDVVTTSSQAASNVVNQGQYLFQSSAAASNVVNQGQYLYKSSAAASNIVNQGQYVFQSSYSAANLNISSSASNAGIGTTGTRFDIVSISFPAGDWDISGGWYLDMNGGTISNPHTEICVGGTTAGNNTTGCTAGSSYFIVNSTASIFSEYSMTSPPVRANLAGTTTLYLKGFLSTYTGAPKIYATFYGRRR